MRIDAYEVLEVLGRGATGTVYRAKTSEGVEVALKVLDRERVGRFERFERERRLLAELDERRGFVQLLDAGVAPEGPFAVLRLVRGGTLRQRLNVGTFSSEEARELVRVLAGAMGNAHALGIVHRDLKPENVLFSEDGTPLIADLGLAKHFSQAEASESASLSRTGEFRGTPGYMPAEQMRSAKDVGPTADVFALGAILYECLVGFPPFADKNVMRTLEKVEQGSHTPPREIRPDVPHWLEAVVAQALAPNPRDRFSDGAALARALSGESARAARLWVAALMLLALAVTLWIVGRGTGESPAPTPDRSAQTQARLPDSGALVVPALCRSFARTKMTRLTGVVGSYTLRHSTSSDAVAFTPRGDLVLSTGGRRDRTLRAWDTDTGDERWAAKVPAREARALAISPDGELAVTGALDGGLALWQVRTGERFLTAPERHGKEVRAVAFLSSRTIVSGGEEGSVRCTDLESMTSCWAPRRGAAVRGIACDPEGRRVAVVRHKAPLELLDAKSGDVVRRLDSTEQPFVIAVAFSPRGETIATLHSTGVLVLRDAVTLEPRSAAMRVGAEFHTLAFAGKRVVTGSWTGDVALWEPGDSLPLATVKPSDRNVSWIAASLDGTRIATSSWDAHIRILDASTLRQQRIPYEGTPNLAAIALVPSGCVALGGIGGILRVADPERNETLLERPLASGAILSLVASRDGSRVWVTTEHGGMFEVSVATGTVTRSSVFREGRLLLACAHQNDCLAVARDGVLVVLEPSSGRTTTVAGSVGEPVTLEWSRDDRLLLVGTSKGEVHVVDVAGAPSTSLTLDSSGKYPALAAFSPGGKEVLVATGRRLVVWNPETGKQREMPDARDADVEGIHFLGERYAAIAEFAERIELLDLEQQRVIDTIDLSASHDLARCFEGVGHDLYVGTARGMVLRFAFEPPH